MNTSFNSIIQKLKHYETAKDDLFIKAVNFDRNEEHLQSVYYQLNSDIALVLYLRGPEFPSGFFSAAVPSDILASWPVPRQLVWDQAMLNTYIFYPPRYYDWLRFFSDFSYSGEDFMHNINFKEFSEGPAGNCISCFSKAGGAVAVFLPGVSRRISQLIGGDFLIAFTSIHEAMVHSTKTVNPKMLKEVLQKMIEENEIKPDEILSTNIFMYNSQTDRIQAVL